MLEVTSGVLDVDRRKRFAQYVYQSILGAGSCSAQNALDLGERFLSLSGSSRHISWMTTKEAEDGLRMLAAGDGSRGIATRPRWRPRPLIEIGEKSLCREPSAGHSEGGVAAEVWRWRWTEPG